MKRYLIETIVMEAYGTQTWYIDAESEKEAIDKFNDGEGDIYESNVEATRIGRPEISGEVSITDSSTPTINHFPTKDELVDKIAEALSCTYHCTRVWSAWQVGTMTVDDFSPVDDSDLPHEIADMILEMFNQ